MKAEVAEGALMSGGSKPLAVSASVLTMNVCGVPLPELVMFAINVLTCIYLLVMIGHKLWLWRRDWKKAQEEDRENS